MYATHPSQFCAKNLKNIKVRKVSILALKNTFFGSKKAKTKVFGLRLKGTVALSTNCMKKWGCKLPKNSFYTPHLFAFRTTPFYGNQVLKCDLFVSS